MEIEANSKCYDSTADQAEWRTQKHELALANDAENCFMSA